MAGSALVAWALAAAVPLPAAGEPVFRDRARATGLDFVHFNGMSGEYYFPEMTGQGGALLDYDGDGDLDVYLVQGAMLGPGKGPEEALRPLPGGGAPRDRLFRNDAVPSAGAGVDPSFVDVTAAAGLTATGYGMGVATGDYDGDGRVDLYVTNYGPNQLWRNRSDGTFEEVAARAGVEADGWSTGATFFDLDRDGRLDLYVTNYVDFDLVESPRCFAPSSRRDYCGPSDFPPQPDRLFRNLGDGAFEEISLRALPGYQAGAGLGVLAADLDRNGWADLYVANDGGLNQLWLNQGDGTFRDEALLAGVAVNREGRPEASMGVDAADFDGDGDEDLFLAHLAGETNTLYVNDGGGLFEDRTIETGLGAPSLPFTAFGAAWIDYDGDGWLDLVLANGAVRVLEAQAAAGEPFPLRLANQLFRNLGGRFEEVAEVAGEDLVREGVGRGLAVGDVDEDGDPDLLLLDNDGPARLLINGSAGAGWSGVRALDAAGGDRAGVEASFVLDTGRTLMRRSRTDGSYASARDPRLVAGLGGAGLTAVRLETPEGREIAWRGVPSGRYLVYRLAPGRTGADSRASHEGGGR